MTTTTTKTTTMATATVIRAPHCPEVAVNGDTQQSNAVKPPESSNDLDHPDELHQDVISQFPLLNGYSHGLYGFQISPDTPRESVVAALQDAVDTLVAQMPWLGGQIAHVPGAPGSSGVDLPAPWPADAPKHVMLRIKHCDDLLPPMSQLVRSGAPISKLDGTVLGPWPSLPAPHGLEPPLPVLVVQANFIRGGLLLNLSPHHVAIDGAGFVQLARLLSTLLCGRGISDADLEQGNRDRSKVIPLIPRGEPVKDMSYLRRPPNMPPPSLPLSDFKWCYFKVPLAAVPALQKLATPPPSATGLASLFSDNDLLCAFTWQRISAVRIARGFAADRPCKYTRAIDGRSAMGVPPSYLGHMTSHAIAQLPLGTAATAPLFTLIQTLRRELNAANTAWAFRSVATFLAREPDKTQIIYGGARDISIDLGATSFVASAATESTADTLPSDFGPLLGRACFMRRPNVTPIPSTITICPAEAGAIPICLCLPEVDFEGLKKDPEWKRFTRVVG